MSVYESLLRPILFSLDPEGVHDFALNMMAKGAISARRFADPRLEQTLFGVRFRNPVGLAAGFDKNAVALEFWDDVGFGFAEVGTITHFAQDGNDRPRLFRLPQDKALINRMGFNNDGARAAAGRIAESRPTIPIGINLGKSRITPLEKAAEDYQASFKLLHNLGAYFVVNVSSPNTPGLRDLQEKSALTDIFRAMKAIDESRPLFVKVSPDLEFDALDQVIEVVNECGLTGVIATNTTLSREGLIEPTIESGGLSGLPLRLRANEVMKHLYRNCTPETVLIGVGGIFDENDLWERIGAGAHLCQLYTGWVYGGPKLVPDMLEQFVIRMQREGIRRIDDLRGKLA